jgi:hypothetical protein
MDCRVLDHEPELYAPLVAMGITGPGGSCDKDQGWMRHECRSVANNHASYVTNPRVSRALPCRIQ